MKNIWLKSKVCSLMRLPDVYQTFAMRDAGGRNKVFIIKKSMLKNCKLKKKIKFRIRKENLHEKNDHRRICIFFLI